MYKAVRRLSSGELLRGMPFADVVDWSRFSHALDFAYIKTLGATLHEKEAHLAAMQQYLGAVQKLFREDGILGYILYRLSTEDE